MRHGACTVMKTIPAIEASNDTYTFPGFDPKASNPCASRLTATQDKTLGPTRSARTP